MVSSSLGVFTFRIVLNRILHKSSLLAPMESRRTRRPTFTAEERLERRREQDRRRHAERRARERQEQTQARRDVDRLRSSQAYKQTKPYTRACCRIRNCRDFQKRVKRKPTCHFPSSVYSLPSLGVFTHFMTNLHRH